ncbi:MAG: hypothetical protein OXP73_05160 [Chloroflexota bacterium]|nr:hypothetical protein [Chloroflexota bacterium]
MEHARRLLTGPLAGWLGRLALLGAVSFWWGAVVAPNLISLAFPEWLSPDAIPRDLNPDIDWEGRLANRVSAAALLVLAVAALVSAAVNRRRGGGRLAMGGWLVLSVTAMVLFWEETSDFHATALPGMARRVFGEGLVSEAGTFVWVLLALPLIAGFVLVMTGFYVRGLRTRAVRWPFALGLAAWVLALVCEAATPAVIKGRAYALMVVLEETLEVGGTLLLTLSAVAVWSRREAIHEVISARGLKVAAIGSASAVVVLGGLFAALVFRVPLADGRVTGGHAEYWVSLADGQSLAQDFPMPAAPIAGVSLRLANRDSESRPGVAVWQLMDSPAGSSGDVLRQGHVEAPAGDLPVWVDVDFAVLTAAEGRRLLLQVAAENEPGSALRVGMVQGNRYADGRLWVNGTLTWPDQDLEFVAHGAAEPTRSKLGSLWHLVSSDWRWSALATKALIALVLVTLIPVFLVCAIWPKSRAGGIPSELR